MIKITSCNQLIMLLCIALALSGCGSSDSDVSVANNGNPEVSAPAIPEPPAGFVDIRSPSVARLWNEVVLESIRNDFARPTSHARNLFHLSAAMYDAWAVFSQQATPYLLGTGLNGFSCPLGAEAEFSRSTQAREQAISFAAYRIIVHRFAHSPSYAYTLVIANKLMQELGFDKSNVQQSRNMGGAELGNYIADCYIRYGLQDGANEANLYQSRYYQPLNPPIEPEQPGNPDIIDLGRWQAIALSLSIDQAGNQVGSVPEFIGAEWGNVAPFALADADRSTRTRNGHGYTLYHDPGSPPYPYGAFNKEYQWNFALVSIWGSHLDPAVTPMVDISPQALGNLDIASFPREFAEYPTFYDLFNGGDISRGRSTNPITGEAYVAQEVPLGDYARVLAEFWADGPDSETPPGHWYVILNYVTDSPEFSRTLWGEEMVGPLEWDIKAYFSLGGAMHDSAITAWSLKGWYDFIRPVSAIRAMADIGQSSDPAKASYHPDGLPLYDGYIELVTADDPLANDNPNNVGKVKLYTWRGPGAISSPETDVAGVGWILAENWWPYQRPTFVTPPFAGYVSGHSTFSRAAAEVLTAVTGSEYFPAGMGEFVAPKDDFLVFEKGPSVDVVLQWATYRDAADQCSLSRIWGGIHPPADDLRGRIMGAKIGQQAVRKAQVLFGW